MKHALVPYHVIHKRLTPKSYTFKHRMFWFKFDLDCLSDWPTRLLGLNKSSLYSFYDRDHLKLGHQSARENFIQFAKNQGLETRIKKVYLYTSVRFLGYVFNPVSFVLLVDELNKEHAIIEIGNTFNEQKPFFVHNKNFNKSGFVFRAKKMFYISPFIEHDNELLFIFKKVGKKISIFIEDKNIRETVLKVSLVGQEKQATTFELLKQTLLVPFVTFKTIYLIHWHALILWIKGIKYFKKNEHQELQQGIFLWKK